MSAVAFPRSRAWESADLLRGLSPGDVGVRGDALSAPRQLFEFDMYTEYDSEHFCQYLERRQQAGAQFSPEFLAFERVWRRDERNHYLGYRRLLAICGGPSEEVSHERMLARSANFAPIEQYLEDEFMICIVLAYDELVTANSCRMDFGLFAAFGDPRFLRWIRLVARDEAYHFLNILDVVRLRHAHRIRQVPGLLARLRQYDGGGNPYMSTFVMDHDPGRFSPMLLDSYCQKIMTTLTARHHGGARYDPQTAGLGQVGR